MLIIGLIVGVAIGWMFPQPQWVKDLFAKIKGSVSS